MDNNLTVYILAFAILGLGFTYGCREPFEPDISAFDQNVLVVEGYLEVGGGISTLRLSRTRPIYERTTFPPVLNADVMIMGAREGTWKMEVNEDLYYYTDAHLPEDQSYVVSIHLGSGQWYLSENIQPLITPEFDITYERRDGNINIYASTHGDENANYFMWDYVETWIYRTPHISAYRYNGELRRMEPLSREEQTFQCWQENISSRVILESASKYQNNQIYQKDLLRIDSLSEKLGQRYHLKVKQRAIDQDAYNFWESVRRNSDDIGNIFSPLPSMISTNLYNAENPDEPVIGFISAGRSKESSMYIDRSEVHPWRSVIQEYSGCFVDTVAPHEYYEVFHVNNYVPLYEDCSVFPCSGFLASTKGCTDCTLRGGRTQRPDFWEDASFND